MAYWLLVGVIRGRAWELAEIERLLSGVAEGAGAAVIIEGPPGIGKSRLLEEAAALGSAKGIIVARGRTDELDQLSPWLVLVQALSSTNPPIVDRLALLSPSDHLDQRGAAVEVLRASLEEVALRTPVMVILDDLQWADQATVAALAALPEQLFSYPIFWLLARRSIPSSPNLDALVARLAASGADRWQLKPLDEAATMALASDVAGQPLQSSAAHVLLATGGNPLFILMAVRDHGAADRRGDGQRGLRGPRGPAAVEPSLQTVVDAHLRSLSPTTVEVLRLASVLGHEFSVGEVSALSARSSAQLLSVIEEAMAAGVLVEAGGGLEFCHDVFRQVLYEGIPGPLRRSLHREAATVLRHHGASPTRLANQLMIGATAGDVEAVAYLHEAIGQLFGTSPWAAADLALRLVDLATPDSEEGAAAVSMAVSLLAWAGRWEEALRLGERFLETSAPSAAMEAEVLLAVRRAWIVRHSRPYPRPLPPGVLENPAVPLPVRAMLLAFDLLSDLRGGDLARGDAGLDEAAAWLTGRGNDLDISSVRPLWVTSAQFRGQYLVALERARHDLQPVEPRSEAAAKAANQSSAAIALSGLGRIQEGLTAVEEAIRAAELSGYSSFLPHCQCLRAAFFLDSGRLEDAKAEASAASASALDSGFLDHAALALTVLIEALVRSGELAAADTALDHMPWGREGGSLNPDQFWASALVAQAHGRESVAMRALEPVFQELAENRFLIANRHPGRLPQLVGLALREGDCQAAQVVVAAAGQLAGANDGVVVLDQIARHCHALLHHDRLLLRQAYGLSQKAETRLLHAILAEDLGSLEAEGGHRSEAVVALEEAFEVFDGMGAHRDATRVRAELRRLGVRKRLAAAGRPKHGWASLTPAEVSVVRVVGRGLTNRAAAEELFISADTVNSHLRHAFAKLEIRSRADLKQLVSTHDR
ncbi:MAG: AAA family ATPase [Acidimicrobiaceae bacterium]|nr:AAA family ATPase [Acidimicrobiaceae bacterium]